LELWLRRIIEAKLSAAYGTDYFNAQDANGANIISTPIRNEIQQRMAAEPGRFPRPIDACLLESEIKIVTNPNLYQNHFRDVFDGAFPNGYAVLRIYLDRLVLPRNKLYHANPISVREAERVICYTNDIVDTIKQYYIDHNMNQQFNVPLILKYSDGFGNVVFREGFGDTIMGGKYVSFEDSPQLVLRPGDTITVELEIDPTFSRNEYRLQWSHFIKDHDDTNKLTYTIQTKDVGENFSVTCNVITNKEWHRLRDCDDYLTVKLKVLPPL
jgi:hypothetical protein